MYILVVVGGDELGKEAGNKAAMEGMMRSRASISIAIF